MKDAAGLPAMTVVQMITDNVPQLLNCNYDRGKMWLYGNVRVEFPGLQ
jgi:hypothetical protein